MKSNLVIDKEVIRDEDYLRNDEDIIKSFLNGEKQILAACGPRRSGKTSFLKRIGRWAHKEEESAKKWAGEKKMDAVYLTFETSIDDVLNVLGDKFKTKLEKPKDFLNILAELDHTVFFLLDECYAGISDQNDGKEKRDIINFIITRVGTKSSVRVAIADVPQFFEICHNEKQGLSAVVFDRPWLLPPISENRKESFLADGAEELLRYKDLVGNIPIESQYLRNWYQEKKEYGEEIDDPVKDKKILIRELVGELRKVFSLIFTTLKDEHKDLLRAVCFGEVKKDIIKGIGGNALTELGLKRGFGMLEIDRSELIKIASPVFKAWISETQQPPLKDRVGEIIVDFKGNKETPSGPHPTFLGGLVIHQIGDLHFGIFGNYDNNRHLAYSYIDYLKNIGGDCELLPHVIIICGDLASKGDDSEIIEASEFLISLKETKTIDKRSLLRPFYEGQSVDWENQVLIVPGNHDSQWITDSNDDPLLNFRENDIIKFFKNPYSKIPAVTYEPVKVSVILFNSAIESGRQITLNPLRTTENIEMCDTLNKVIQDSYQKVLKGLMSMSQNIDDRDRASLLKNWVRFTSGYISKDDLDRIEGNLKSSEEEHIFKSEYSTILPPIRIGVCHHNLYNMYESELFTDLVNSGEVRQGILENNISIILYGHTHHSCVSTEVEHNSNTKFHSIGVGSLGIDPNIATFNEIIIKTQPESYQDQNVREVTIAIYDYKRVKGSIAYNWDRTNTISIMV